MQTTTQQKSAKAKGKRNLRALRKFLALRRRSNDWPNWACSDKSRLLRHKIAIECKFSKSVLRQNPAVKQLLIQVEVDLKMRGILTAKTRTSHELEGIHHATLRNTARYATRLASMKDDLSSLNGILEEFDQKRIAITAASAAIQNKPGGTNADV